MTIRFDIPAAIESLFREMGAEPNSAVKEAALVDLYRLRRINHHQLAQALGIERLEVDAILKRYDVPLDLSIEDFHAELASLQRGLAR